MANNMFSNQNAASAARAVDDSSLLLKKTFNCPCCDGIFKNEVVKSGRARQIGQDIDLRPHCEGVDPLKYGVIVCPDCGYAALSNCFGKITSSQIKFVKEKITSSYTGYNLYNEMTYDDAIARHKLALLNSMACGSKVSERAYLCLLIGWLMRANAELEKVDDDPNVQQEIKAYLKKAGDGFRTAYAQERFPICGMDENTFVYLLAALDYETGEYEEALKWASKLISSNNTIERIKERAREIRNLAKTGLGVSGNDN